jgi:uncharacterized membrane protein YhhN
MPVAELATGSVVALGVAGVCALANWWSVTVGRRTVEWVSKPSVMVALIAAAVLLRPSSGAVRAWVVVGLVCSLAGDVFLMLPEERFVEGLASFLLAHVAYIVAFFVAGTSATGAAIGVVIVALGVTLVARPILRAVRSEHADFAVPVLAYVSIISVMVVAAWATSNPWAIVGAMSFYASDGTLAWNKFVHPIKGGRFAIMSTYHLAQFAIVVSLAR